MNTNFYVFEVFPWNSNFETGNSIIDEHHKVLVSLLNKLAITLINQDKAEIDSTFEELTAYANKHFAYEEEIWSNYFTDDPWLLSHNKTHSSFLPSVMDIKKQAADKPLPDIIENVVHFLVKWLIFHIIDTDKRMVLVMNALESGATIDEAKHLAEEKMTGSKLILIDAILKMYEGLSSRTLSLMREMKAKKEAEEQLNEANNKLEALIITDPLTCLFNRRHFDNTFELLKRKAMRDKKILCFMLIDIDYFKNINDYYGHLIGDQALEQLGSCLLELCRRPEDMAFRIGGDEFSVLTINKGKKHAFQFAEKIRMAIEDLKVTNKQSEASDYMTVSIGVIHKIPCIKDNQDEFIKVADKRLYKAKTLGRNKVVISH